MVAFFSRSNLEDTFEPNWICSSNASNFTQEAMNYGMWDISRLLEQWTCAKAKGSCTVNTLSTMQKECSKIINGTLSKFSLSHLALLLKLNCRNGFSVETGTYELRQLRCKGRRSIPYQARRLDLSRVQEPL